MVHAIASINWNSVLSAFIGAVPGLIVSLLVIRFTTGLNKSIEKLKSEFQQDNVKFSKWHEKRVDACVTIYNAFRAYLDFLRLALYWEHRGMSMDPMHEFKYAIEQNIIFLDDALAEKVLRYQGELLVFWNDSIGVVGTEPVQKKLDYDIPAYLRRLRSDINESLDPNYKKKDLLKSVLLHPYAEVQA